MNQGVTLQFETLQELFAFKEVAKLTSYRVELFDKMLTCQISAEVMALVRQFKSVELKNMIGSHPVKSQTLKLNEDEGLMLTDCLTQLYGIE